MQYALRHSEVGFAIRPLELCVVVPVLNERANVAELIQRIGQALADVEWEIMFVDDGSRDGTPELITQLSADDRRIRLIRQNAANNAPALSRPCQ